MKKFGVDQELQEKYMHHHADLDCDGTWSAISDLDIPYRVEEGMMVVIKHAPMVKCDKCGAMYFQEGFEQAFLQYFAKSLALTTRQLHKSEIRFLRTFIGFTQEKLGSALGIAKTDISKYESIKAKEPRRMDDGLMVQFKLLVASELGVSIPPELNLWKVERLSSAKSPVIDAQEIKVV